MQQIKTESSALIVKRTVWRKSKVGGSTAATSECANAQPKLSRLGQCTRGVLLGIVGFSAFAVSTFYAPQALAQVSGEAVMRYRVYSPTGKRHFYSTDKNEVGLLPQGGWQVEGPVYKLLKGPGSIDGVPAVPLYRLYSPILFKHFWTTDVVESAALTAAGWVAEGADGYVSSKKTASTVPLHRLYLPSIREHLWTTDENEKTVLTTRSGWIFEGTIGYVIPLSAAELANRPPVAAVEVSASTALVTGASMTLAATVTDPDNNVTKVSFYDGYSLLGSKTSAPFTIELTNSRFGQRNFVAVAEDSLGAIKSSTVYPIEIQPIPQDIVRLLKQSSFGPTPATLQEAQTVGAAAYIDAQLNMPITSYPAYPFMPQNKPDSCIDACERNNYSLYKLQNDFFINTQTAPDQLRQRVAFALSQIFVVSGNEEQIAYANRNYQQLLMDLSFGNFNDILYLVTLHPLMGRYLDMVNNAKATSPTGVQPNENYARELLQLFSIGIWELNQDGTYKRGADGNPIASYDQADILNFSKVLTGWTYPPLAGSTARFNSPTNYFGAMVQIENQHDVTAKTLLGDVVSPAGLAAQPDLRRAIDNVFVHPNVGPFISRQLIQHLVTSNPSPAYVGRVAAVFNNNGLGVRGDMKATVRAILLDPEARGDASDNPKFGRLREPVHLTASFARAMGAATDGIYLKNVSAQMGQNLFYSPTVFNYYPADYIVPGTNLEGPQFGIYNATTAFTRANFFYQMTFGNGSNADTGVAGSIGTKIDMTVLRAISGEPWRLVDRINSQLMFGSMNAQMRNAIIDAVTAVAVTDTAGRANTALYLASQSMQFQVER
jgi:uncharacterized protein (DUF1800 family)